MIAAYNSKDSDSKRHQRCIAFQNLPPFMLLLATKDIDDLFLSTLVYIVLAHCKLKKSVVTRSLLYFCTHEEPKIKKYIRKRES